MVIFKVFAHVKFGFLGREREEGRSREREMEEDQDPTATNRSLVEPTINPSYGSP